DHPAQGRPRLRRRQLPRAVRKHRAGPGPPGRAGRPPTCLRLTTMLDNADKAVNQGVAPVTYGQGERPPRGDYASARADYTCEQRWSDYTAQEHDLYRRLYERQAAQLPGLACAEFIEAVEHLGHPAQVPRFDELSEKLYRATKWEAVAVPGLIPEEAFFALLAKRKFPVTRWLRTPEEFDYI